MAEHKAEFGKDDFYHHEMELLHAELKEAAHDLQLALMIVYIQLMLPINLFHRYYFFKRTNRKSTGMTINDYLEYLTFFTTALTLYKQKQFEEIDKTNKYIDF